MEKTRDKRIYLAMYTTPWYTPQRLQIGKSAYHSDPYTTMLIPALFTTATSLNQPGCLPTEKLI